MPEIDNSTPEAGLDHAPIEIPDLNTWRWRAQLVLRSSGLDTDANYRTDVSYFFDNLASSYRKPTYAPRGVMPDKVRSTIKLDSLDWYKHSTSEHPLVELLGEDMLTFGHNQGTDAYTYLQNRKVIIKDPSDFINRLSGASYVRTFTQVSPMAEDYPASERPHAILPGLARVLQATQDGSIYDIEYTRSLLPPMPSFNALVQQAAQQPDHLDRVVEAYITSLRFQPVSEIAARIALHDQLSTASKALAEDL